jgi:hypothetical protein
MATTRNIILLCLMVPTFLVSIVLTGCGFSVPSIQEGWQGPEGTEALEFEIKKTIYCQLKEAIRIVEEIKYSYQDNTTKQVISEVLVPNDWIAQISLLLQVDEATAFNPGIGITQPFANSVSKFSNGTVTTPQLFSLGLGATVSGTSTRIDKFNPYYTIEYLRIPNTPQSVCVNPKNDPFLNNPQTSSFGSLLIESDLGIIRWLHDAAITDRLLRSAGPAPKTTPYSIEIKFVVVTSGNINPVWKLIPVTFNNGSNSLLTGARTRTHDVIITIGPPDQNTLNSHLASQVGQAFSSALSSTPTTSTPTTSIP